MAEYLIQSETLDAIADAINAKTGGSSAMTPAEMVTEIGSIQTGGGDTGDFTHLDTFTLSEDVAYLDIDISAYNYKEFAIVVDASGTGADYLYICPSKTSNYYAVYKSGNAYSFIAVLVLTDPGEIGNYSMGKYVSGFSPSFSSGGATATVSVSSFATIRCKSYRTNGVLNAGGTFALYGR